MRDHGLDLFFTFGLCLLACGRNPVVQGQEVSLRVAPAQGEPGEEVAVEFWAAFLKKPDSYFAILFELDPEAAVFIRTETKGTASAHAPPRGIIYVQKFIDQNLGPGYLAGVLFGRIHHAVTLEPGDNLLLLKAIFRISIDAAPGEYPIHIKNAEFDTGGLNTLSVAMGAAAMTPSSRMTSSSAGATRRFTSPSGSSGMGCSWKSWPATVSVSLMSDQVLASIATGSSA